MGKRSKKPGKALSPQIKTGVVFASPKVTAISSNLGVLLDKDHVSVSLRYYQRSCECFSSWVKPELKKFSATIDKIRNYSADQLKLTYSLCVIHKNAPHEDRFSLPSELALDITLHEIKIDPSNKLRMHGFFEGSVFFLVWLDREHACFPS